MRIRSYQCSSFRRGRAENVPRRATGMSGSDKMEVDDGPPPVVVVDQGQDAKTPGSEEKKKWAIAETVEHGFL